MILQFVVLDDFEETDWIDPIESVEESGQAWFVDNGITIYKIPKLPGRTIAVRPVGQ